MALCPLKAGGTHLFMAISQNCQAYRLSQINKYLNLPECHDFIAVFLQIGA